MRSIVLLSLVLGLVFGSAASMAAGPPDMAGLKAGVQLQVPVADSDEDKSDTLQVDGVGTFTNQSGGRWYRLDGRLADGKASTVFVDPSASPAEASVVLRRLTLRQLKARPQLIWRIDKAGEGELVFEDQHYRFSDDDSDDARYVDAKSGAAGREMSFYVFHCVEDDDLSLVVLEWGDDDFEVYQTGAVDAAKIVQK